MIQRGVSQGEGRGGRRETGDGQPEMFSSSRRESRITCEASVTPSLSACKDDGEEERGGTNRASNSETALEGHALCSDPVISRQARQVTTLLSSGGDVGLLMCCSSEEDQGRAEGGEGRDEQDYWPTVLRGMESFCCLFIDWVSEMKKRRERGRTRNDDH